MGTYLKLFIFASLFYLGLAAVFGILNGVADPGYFGSFAHTHFNLLGFMSMIVFGVGYFILPRFNGTDLRFPGWVPVHFWLGNISLIGIVTFRGLQVDTGHDIFTPLFVVSAVLQVVSIFMFIVNIWITLTPLKTPRKTTESEPSTPASPPIVANSETSIVDLVDRVPSVKQVLVDAGLKMLAVPGHMDKVRKVGVTVGMAANNHGIDLNELISRIEVEIAHCHKAPRTSGPNGQFTSDMLIGKLIQDYPASKMVFQRHFGDGCFDCPGQSYESIDMACRMHGVNPEKFIGELQEAVK